MTRRRIDPIAEARRLRAVADEAADRLALLEGQREAALDTSGYGPHPTAIEHARRHAEACEAAAETTERMAGEGLAA